MSVIDVFKHEEIGSVRCLMRHPLYKDGRIFDSLPVYRLLEDVSDEISLSGKAGDIVIGGGFGEASALRFSVPEIFRFFRNGAPAWQALPIVSHWSADDAFLFGVGYEAVGWRHGKQELFLWLAAHLVAFLVRVYPDRYRQLLSDAVPGQDGSIFITK